MHKTQRGTKGSIANRFAYLQKQPNLLPIEELQDTYTLQLKDALTQLGDILSQVSVVEMVTATNHNSERDKWLEAAMQGKFRIPELRYNYELLYQVSHYRGELEDTVLPQLNAALQKLPQNRAGHVLSKLVEYRLKDAEAIINLADALLCGDGMTATSKIVSLYGLPSNHTVKIAYDTIKQRKAGQVITSDQPTILTPSGRELLSNVQLNAGAIAGIFQWVAEQYNIAGTRPILTSNQVTASADVRDTSTRGPVVLIATDHTASALSAVSLAIHEVGCHWRDSENMQYLLPRIGAGALKPVDELLYEGHAVAEGYATTLALQGWQKEPRSLYYPVAINLAYRKHNLFCETAKELYELIKTEAEPTETTLRNVWQVTYRVYRGNPHPHVRNGYAYTKDRAYFCGKILAEELKQVGMEHLLEYGTLTLQDLQLLAQNFQLDAPLPYPNQPDLATRLCEKLLREYA